MSLKIVVTEDHDRMSAVAAGLVSDVLSDRPDAAVVAATGRTPAGLYEELANRQRAGAVNGSRVRLFQLDEYVGIERGDRRSLFGWLVRTVAAPLGIDAELIVGFSVDGDHASTCASYDAAVADAGGFDLAILGVGSNGHLGFNEPPSPADAPTRVVRLSPESMETNARYWGDDVEVPGSAFTAGMGLLLAARKILLLASGPHKRDIVHRALHGPITPSVPASALQSAPDVIAVVDRAAWSDGSGGVGTEP